MQKGIAALGDFYVHGHLKEICQQADGHPAREYLPWQTQQEEMEMNEYGIFR